LKKDIEKTVDNCFISRYHDLFNNALQQLSPFTRDTIRKNKELDKIYDLFLDFIIDASQHLDYMYAKEKEKEISEVNSKTI